VSEDGAAVPAPYVLDVSVVVAVARGDTEIMTFIQRLDGTGQPMVIPVLAITAASLDVRYFAVGSNVWRIPQKTMNDETIRTGMENRMRRAMNLIMCAEVSSLLLCPDLAVGAQQSNEHWSGQLLTVQVLMFHHGPITTLTLKSPLIRSP